DETRARVSGVPHLADVASTGLLTIIECHGNRGSVAVDAMGILPTFSGVAVHDRLASYWRYPASTLAPSPLRRPT
ncbi:MAG: hypothetical protein ACREJP_10880, partial [Candidatus Methylomirabilales bacterium]